MAGAMRQPGQGVGRAEACSDDGRARARVDILARGAEPCCGKARSLRLLLQVPDLALADGRLAENVRAGDVGPVALHEGAEIHQHHVAVLQRLRIVDAVGIGGRLAEQDQRRTGRRRGAEALVGLGDEGLHLGRG